MLQLSTTELPAVRPQPTGRGQFLRGRLALACIASAALAALTFAPSTGHPFVYDDRPFIEFNPVVTQSGPWYRFWREPFWPKAAGFGDTLYRPFTTWTYRADTVLGRTGRPEPRVVHITNITLHALTSAAVVLIAFGLSRRVSAGLVAGVLFAVHPLHTEAVVTGYGRSEVLAGFFGACLLAMQINLRRPRPKWFHPLSAVIYLLAIMSKEHALLLWPALTAIEYWPGASKTEVKMPRREWFNRVLIPSQVGFILATSCFFMLRASVFGATSFLEASRTRFWEVPLAHAGLIEHLLTPFRLLWISFELCVWPGRLCPIWSIPSTPLANRLAPDVLAGMGLLVLLLAAARGCWLRKRLVGALVLGQVLTLTIPVQAFSMARWYFAERWLYLPSVLAAVLFGIAVARLRWPAVMLALTAGLALLPASWAYSRAFESELAINRGVVARQPNNYQGHRNLARVLLTANDYQGAIQEAHEIIERFDRVGRVDDAYADLTLAYLALGDGENALEAVTTLQRLRADIPDPSWTSKEFEARALIAQKRARQAAATQPASASAPAI
jgi:protein O-mannosyl-transferase